MEHRSDMETKIRIGPAGWSYEDWMGIAYPRRGRIDTLVYIASRFNTIELNSSFYRIPGDRTVRSWARRLSGIDDFQFSIKVLQAFTHGDGGDRQLASSFIESFEPLSETRRVGAFLLQFPWSFKNSAESRERLMTLSEWFEGHPTAVELRHGSWNDAETLRLFESKELAFCNIDQPQIGDSIPPSNHTTSESIGYIRLHGRNRSNWFNREATRDERYDYLYDRDELEEWSRRAADMMGKTRTLFIITNNHFRGQALVNAFQLRHLLEGKRCDIPPTLRRSYPSLEDISIPGRGQIDLLE